MEPDIINTIAVTSFAPASLLLIWKILIPLVNVFIARVNKTDTSADARLCKIENDFTHEVRADIKELKEGTEYLRREFEGVKIRVAVLESKIITA